MIPSASCPKTSPESYLAGAGPRAGLSDRVRSGADRGRGISRSSTPEEYGGSGLGLGAATAVLEEVHRSGCNGGACHAQMYTMGTVLKHGSAEQKAALSAGHRLR